MALEHLKALASLRRSRNGALDYRSRSPKAMGDWSGVLLNGVTAHGTQAVQEFDYETLSQLYICHDLVWTCINLVSSQAALAKLRVRRKSESGTTYLPDHDLQHILDAPNASMTQFDLIQSYIVHQMLYGHVTLIVLREKMTKVCPDCRRSGEEECLHTFCYDYKSKVRQIETVHPDNITREYVAADRKYRFFYTPKGQSGAKYLIHPNNIITDPYYNPDAAWYGVSPTHILSRWLKLDTTMTGQISHYFENGAIPSMIVSLKPVAGHVYSDEPSTLVQRMKEGWMNQFSRGRKEPAFVFGDIDVERLQDKVNEVVGKDLYYEIAGRVCATYGVPPNLYEIGLRYGSQRASAMQAERDFFNRTISVILSRFKRKIEQAILPSWGDDLELVWDYSDMGIASFLVKDKDERVSKHWQLGLIQRNTAQTLLGYEPDSSELGDDYYRLTVMGDGSSTTTNQLDNNLEVPIETDE